MKACVHCAEEIQDAAAVCRHCGRPVPFGAVNISHRGNRFGVGVHEAGQYAVWDLSAGGAPIVTHAKSDEGWVHAWSAFQQAEGGHGPAPLGTPTTVMPAATNGLAIASLVLGIVWLWGIGSVLALIFGVVAKNQIDATGGRQQGRGMAIAGIVLGLVGLGIVLLVIIVAAASTPSFY